jgi:site-specific recombinase XerD
MSPSTPELPPRVDVEALAFDPVHRAPDRNPALVYLARLAPGSRRAMGQALRVLVGLVRGPDVERFPWHLLRYAHTQAMRAKIAERYAPQSANKILCALRGVLKECARLELMSAEEALRASDLPSLRGSRLPRGRALAAGELKALFDACDGSAAHGARDAALLALLYGAGLRRSEAVRVELRDLDLVGGSIRVTGKGDRQRAVPFATGVREVIERWLLVRAEAPGPLLLPVRKGGRIVPDGLGGQAVLMILRRLAKRCGVAPFSPHDARRSFISDLLDAGADISTVQQLAGHAQVTTTTRYDRRGEHTRRRAMGMLHLPIRAA